MVELLHHTNYLPRFLHVVHHCTLHQEVHLGEHQHYSTSLVVALALALVLVLVRAQVKVDATYKVTIHMSITKEN